MTQARRVNVLALSYLFPNRAHPSYGIFVLNRLKAAHEHCSMRVVAPVQWYPFMAWLRGALWSADVPRHEIIEGLDVHHPRFPVIPRYMKWFDALSYYWAALSVVKRLRGESFEMDLIDAHWTYPDVVAAYWLARRYRKPFIVTVRGHEALYLEERTLRRRMVAYYLRKADLVVTLSEELRDKVVGLGVAPQRARVVLNGVDRSRFRRMDQADCRARLGLPQDKRILISVGRFTENKGHHDIIKALPTIQRRYPLELYIIGGINPEDSFEKELRTLIADLGLTNVHLLGKVDHDRLPTWYGAADLFCLATHREGCPNAVLEALSCGTPAVVAEVGAVRALIKPGENGYLLTSYETESIARALIQALDHEWERGRIAAGMESWGWSRCGQQVVELYHAVTNAGVIGHQLPHPP